jgi:hypothetical protein
MLLPSCYLLLPSSAALRVGDTAIDQAVVPTPAYASSTKALNRDPALPSLLTRRRSPASSTKVHCRPQQHDHGRNVTYTQSLTPSPGPHWAHAECDAPSTQTTVRGIGTSMSEPRPDEGSPLLAVSVPYDIFAECKAPWFGNAYSSSAMRNSTTFSPPAGTFEKPFAKLQKNPGPQRWMPACSDAG